MNRSDILETLRAFPYPETGYWLLTGGAMVLYGIREETGDVDLGCTSTLADRLEADGHLTGYLKDGMRRFAVGDCIEVFENWLNGTVETVEGIPVVSIDGLIAMKRELNREKDRRDIQLIEAWLAKKDRP